MSEITKKALAESLKKLLSKNKLNKINLILNAYKHFIDLLE